MAEEETKKPKKEKPQGGFFRKYLRNPLVTAVNTILPRRIAKFKYKRTDVYTPEIKLRPLYHILVSRLGKLKKLEERWEGKGEEKGIQKSSEEGLRPEIQKIYMDIGQYTSSECISQERLTVRYGNYKNKHNPKVKDILTDKERGMTILGEYYKVPSPVPVYVYFPDGEVHVLRVYGFHRKEFWEGQYHKFLEYVCEDILKRFKDGKIKTTESADEKKVEENLRFVMDVINPYINNIFNFLVEQIGVPHHGIIWGAVTAEDKPSKGACGAREIELKQMLSSVLSTRPYNTKEGEKSDIVYDHTYYIIKPIPSDEDIQKWNDYINYNEELLIEEAGKDIPKEVLKRSIERANKRIGELKELQKKKREELEKAGFKKLDDEVDWGLDENGMPLEVDEHGHVLLDKWNKLRTVRKVPAEFIITCDMLDIINYIHNEWDSYRDDLRDGRYHPKSLTAVDYIMAANPKRGFWKAKKDRNMERGYGKYKMKLRKPWLNQTEIEGEREPTNLSPAFDHKAGFDWQHIGRKYYYDPVDYVAKEDMPKGVLTTRGLSNYIVWRVVFLGGGMKTWLETKEALQKIREGMVKEGYDIGPRMVGWDFNPDPFQITTIQKLNEGIAKNEKAKE